MAPFGSLIDKLFGNAQPIDQQSVVLVDVRTVAEYQRSHIAGTLHLPLNQLAELATQRLPDKSAHIIVFCQSGMRSAQAKQHLIKMGYTRVENGGGIGGVARRLKH